MQRQGMAQSSEPNVVGALGQLTKQSQRIDFDGEILVERMLDRAERIEPKRVAVLDKLHNIIDDSRVIAAGWAFDLAVHTES